MLKEILATKRAEIKALYERKAEIEEKAKHLELPRHSFLEALKNPHRKSALIAEVKKASPSKGVIRPDFNPVQIALDYQKAGADALSVLTDVTYFQGKGDYIRQIKEKVPLPVLRKDFIIDPLQVKESVALGADAILLIAKALPAIELFALYKMAQEEGLDCLVEVSSLTELEEVLAQFTPAIIGVNNRDLYTFQTSVERTKELLPHLPREAVIISESGINSSQVVEELTRLGVHGFLVGEYFMRQENIIQAVEQLYGAT